MMLPTGALVVTAIVAPWYIAIYAQHGWMYIADFLLRENLGRYAETFGLQDRGPWFYLGILLTDLFPWALLLPAAIVAAMSGPLPESRTAETQSLSRLLLVWMVVIVGVFTFSHTKQDLYIFPIVPALAVLMALALDDASLRDGRPGRLMTGSLVATAVILAVVSVGLEWLFGSVAGPNRIAGATTMAIIIGAGAVVTLLSVIRRITAGAVAAIAVTTVAANVVLVLVALPAFEPILPMTQIIQQHARPGAVVAQYQVILPSMVFYLGRPIEPFFDIPSLAGRAEAASEMYLVIRPAEYDIFRTQAQVSSCVLDRRPLFEAKMANVLRREPWPELLLVGVGAACGH
jgi:4-amino-4-deoxy-L-arabinose transferase-like glycosyltransferase